MTNYKEIESFVESLFSDKSTIEEVIKFVMNLKQNWIIEKIISNLAETAYYLANEEVLIEVIKVIRRYDDLAAEMVTSNLAEIARYLRNEEVLNEVLKVISNYRGFVAAKIVKKLAQNVKNSKNIEDLKFLCEVFNNNEFVKTMKKCNNLVCEILVEDLADFAYYVKDKEVINNILEATKEYEDRISTRIFRILKQIAEYFKDRKIDIKKLNEFIEIFKNKKVGNTIVFSNITPEEIIKHYELIKNEGVEGVIKISIGKILGISPYDINFYEKLKEKSKEIGIDLSKLTTAEILYVKKSLEILNKEEQTDFKKAINLLFNDYWNDKEILEITNEMKNFGINVEKLKGNVWVYSKDGEIENLIANYEKLKDYLIIALIGSKNPEKYKTAYSIISKLVGKEKLDNAKKVLEKESELRYQIFKLYKENKTEKITELLEIFALENNIEDLYDIIQTIKGYKEGIIKGNYLIGFYGKHPVNMFSNYSTMCCALLPNGIDKRAAITYTLDPRIITIGYSFVEDFERGKEIDAVREKGELDGLVIGYIALYNGKPILIVDSVEGGRAFRTYLERNFGKIESDIKRVAREIGVKYILYNANASGETPKVFLNLLKNYSSPKTEIIFIEMISKKEIPYINDFEQYLEAFGGWNIPIGVVEGYLYKI